MLAAKTVACVSLLGIFSRFHRVLHPGRWNPDRSTQCSISLVFSNLVFKLDSRPFLLAGFEGAQGIFKVKINFFSVQPPPHEGAWPVLAFGCLIGLYWNEVTRQSWPNKIQCPETLTLASLPGDKGRLCSSGDMGDESVNEATGPLTSDSHNHRQCRQSIQSLYYHRTPQVTAGPRNAPTGPPQEESPRVTYRKRQPAFHKNLY